jgi:hypothetical protein
MPSNDSGGTYARCGKKRKFRSPTSWLRMSRFAATSSSGEWKNLEFSSSHCCELFSFPRSGVKIPKCFRNIPHALRTQHLHMILRSTQTFQWNDIPICHSSCLFASPSFCGKPKLSDLTFIIGSRTGGALTMKLTTTMMAVAALCTLASGCVSTQTAADRASTVRLKLNAAQDEAYLNP